MLMFLGVVAAGGLLIALIMVLHRLQHERKVEAVDRTIPLPPLDPQDKQRVLAIAPELDLNDTTSTNEKQKDLPERTVEEALGSTKDWQANAREHAAAQDYPRAVSCCAMAFPQKGAFRLAAQILRSQIRVAQKQGASLDAPLKDLYCIAAWLEMLHGRLPEYTVITNAQLQQLDLRAWRDFQFDYQTLGCNHLDLLTVTDRKLITQAWGNPKQHTHPRVIYDKDLQSMLASSSDSTGGP